MMDGILRRVSKMPEQRSLCWILIVIMIVALPGCSCSETQLAGDTDSGIHAGGKLS